MGDRDPDRIEIKIRALDAAAFEEYLRTKEAREAFERLDPLVRRPTAPWAEPDTSIEAPAFVELGGKPVIRQTYPIDRRDKPAVRAFMLGIGTGVLVWTVIGFWLWYALAR